MTAVTQYFNAARRAPLPVRWATMERQLVECLSDTALLGNESATQGDSTATLQSVVWDATPTPRSNRRTALQ